MAESRPMNGSYVRLYPCLPSCLLHLPLLQHLLEEVQSAGLLCPAVVPPLLEALLPQHRQELSFRLTQLRQQYIDYQQQEPQDGVLPNPAAAEAFVQHLQQLTSVDVLLMTSIASQQWQADVSFVLMQGVTQTPR